MLGAALAEATGDRAGARLLPANSRVSGEWRPPQGYRPGPYARQSEYAYRDGEYTPGEDGTFAQNYQDVWFEAVAEYNNWLHTPGFYMDLGAFQAWQCSNTALLDLKYNWTGVCVEPRDIDLTSRHCAVVNRPLLGPGTDYDVRMGGHRDNGSQIFGVDHHGSHRGYVTKSMNMEALLHCVDPRRDAVGYNCDGTRSRVEVPKFIHLVSMDTEQTEYRLLQSWPWDDITVGVFIIENLGDGDAHRGVRRIMREQGYILTPTRHPGVDEYWVRPEYWDASLAAKAWRIHPEGSFGC